MQEMNPDAKIRDLAPTFIDIHTALALGRISIVSLGDLLQMTREDFLFRSLKCGRPQRPGMVRLARKPYFGKKAEEKTFEFMRKNELKFRQSS
jgi:hypothetical protein